MQFNYSMKNIPMSSTVQAYMKKMLNQGENFLRRANWAAFFAMNKHITQSTLETFGFKNPNAPPFVKEFEEFKKAFLEMIRNIKFTHTGNDFQTQLKSDTFKIKHTPEIIVPADKTRNWYKVPIGDHKKLLEEAVTKEYKRCGQEDIDKVNEETAKIAHTLQLHDRMEKFTVRDAYITLKDHKPNFPSRISTRLINPAKTDLGIVSHRILQELNSEIVSQTKTNQWRSTKSVIGWFNRIKSTARTTFIKFDIENFYPSISRELLVKALDWASGFCKISDRNRGIILQARKTFLFIEGKPWTKKNTVNHFDIPMGSWDGAECCELIGLFMLSKLTQKIFKPDEVGIYRDDGLGTVRGPGRVAERKRKDISELFKEYGLGITSDTNLTATDYLDVYFNLEDKSYRPFRKPNDHPQYIHKLSNHPKNIIKQLPKMIAYRLSVLSSTEKIFKEASDIYINALRASGYTDSDLDDFRYTPPDPNKKKRRQRCRRVIWFNPPFDLSVETDIGHKFLALVGRSFPKGHPLHSTLNRNTVKISYCTMNNMKSHIDQHNKSILNPRTVEANNNGCNCIRSRKAECPLDGKCLQDSIVYQADIIPSDPNNNLGTKTYYGCTGRPFKKRYYDHKNALSNRDSSKQTTLSKHIWELKDKNVEHRIKWSIKARAATYKGGARYCNLCLSEKLTILMADQESTLNSRSEILGKCRHKWKYCLGSIKIN